MPKKLCCFVLTFLYLPLVSCGPQPASGEPAAGQAHAAALKPKLPMRDVVQDTLQMIAVVPPVSAWDKRQRETFARLLSGHKIDVLVLPVQVQGNAFDRAERALMGAQLAAHLQQTLGLPVADPFLAARALGEGQRTLDPAQATALADGLHAKLLVWSYAGFDHTGKMNLTVQVQERSQQGWSAPRQKDWTGLTFDDRRLPSIVLAGLWQEVDAFLGARGPLPEALTYPAAGAIPLPEAALGIIAETAPRSAMLDAYHMQLLGVLYPSEPELGRERMFVRSLLAVDRASAASPDYRLLRARALFHLGRRPAALEALGTPQTPAEHALLAALNGNLPELEKHAALIDSPVARLTAYVELSELRRDYGLGDEDWFQREVVAQAAALPEWSFLVQWRRMEWEPWKRDSNLTLKSWLDRMFPVSGFTAESLARSQTVLATESADPGRLELSVQEHLARLLQDRPGEWCCEPYTAQPGRWDLLNLAESMAEANLVRHIRFYLNTQGQPDTALTVSDRLEAVYRGHCELAKERAETLAALSRRQQGPEQNNSLQQAVQVARDAIYWCDSRTTVFNEVVDFLGKHDAPASKQPLVISNLGADFPTALNRPVRRMSLPREHARRKLDYATTNFHALQVMVVAAGSEPAAEQLLAENAQRFVGSSTRMEFLVWRAQLRGDTATATALYEEARTRSPRDWGAYYRLGDLKLKAGDVEGAARVFQSFPPFTQPGNDNRVGLSNHAYEAGSLLYWCGAIEQAVALYRLAAGYNSGSDASLTSALRLKVLEGRYTDAAAESLERAKRYHSVYAYRDYLAWLHVLGFGKEAWLGFDELMMAFENPQVWASALVGHRKDGITDTKLREWLLQDRVRNAQVNGRRFAPAYAVLVNVVDRAPDGGFVGLVEALESEPAAVVSAQGTTARRAPSSRSQGGWEILGPSMFRQNGRPARPEGESVKSELIYFAKAYTQISNGDYPGAFESFTEASGDYALEATWMLPYFAWAAAKSGNGAEFDSFVDMVPHERDFDFHLSKAFLNGVRGDHDSAIAHLRSALFLRPHTEFRPVFTEYQYAQACEWLFEATGQDAYLVLALDWVRKHQRIQPMYAWAYAMEAKLSRSPKERKRALGFALYLDPHSAHIAKFSQSDRAQAQAWFKRNNVFAAKPRAQPASKQGA